MCGRCTINERNLIFVRVVRVMKSISYIESTGAMSSIPTRASNTTKQCLWVRYRDRLSVVYHTFCKAQVAAMQLGLLRDRFADSQRIRNASLLLREVSEPTAPASNHALKSRLSSLARLSMSSR